MTQSELEHSKTNLIQISNNTNITIKEINKNKEQSFLLDYAFDERTSQEALYNTIIKQHLRPLFDSKHATIFSYGASGSGKTYT